MIDFKQITKDLKTEYFKYLNEQEYGCGYSFANLYLWGDQRLAFVNSRAVILATFGKDTMYHYPIGDGDITPVVNAVILDANERGIPLRFIGITPKNKTELELAFPNRFEFTFNRDSFDYVYSVDDLADLKGKKYHRKRNHLKRFETAHPNSVVVPLSDEIIGSVTQMVDEWFSSRITITHDEDFDLEKQAIYKALKDYKDLGMDGLVLMEDGEVLAVTLGNRMTDSLVDVNFEKARADVDGAYTKINNAFAQYIRNKYPEVKFLNREEDMGIEGLRKAKESYYPDHMSEKYSAKLK